LVVAQAAHAVHVTPGSVVLEALHATRDLDATVVDANGFTVPGQAVTWSVAPSGIASVNTNGLVKALANGSTTVRATAGSVFGTASVTVAQRVASIELSVECAGFAPPPGVSGPAGVVPPTTTCETLVAFGDQAQVVAEARDANGFLVASADIEWTSSAPQFAPVDEDGLVMAIANGTTTITAEADGVVAEVDITVRQEVASLTVEPTMLYLERGEQGQLTALPKDANGYLVADAVVSWHSASGIASVDANGLVTALAVGQCSVFAEHGDFEAAASVSVMP